MRAVPRHCTQEPGVCLRVPKQAGLLHASVPGHTRVAMDTLSARTSKPELKSRKGMGTLVWEEVGSEGFAMGRLGALRIQVCCIDGYKSVSVPLRLFDISAIGNRPPQRWPAVAVECCPNLKPTLVFQWTRPLTSFGEKSPIMEEAPSLRAGPAPCWISEYETVFLLRLRLFPHLSADWSALRFHSGSGAES